MDIGSAYDAQAGQVIIREVGLRDGLQMVSQYPATQEKKEWMRRELSAGVRHIEVGSFLPARHYPQFADVKDLVSNEDLIGVHKSALTMNERGISDAFNTNISEIVCVVSATEEHSQRNMKRSQDASLDLISFAKSLHEERDKILIAVAIPMSFGCSISGNVKPENVATLAETCVKNGAELLIIADTVGFAGPNNIRVVLENIRATGISTPISLHLHDTRGLGLANAAAAMDEGIYIFDSSIGGLGGCPFAPGATGNVVTEDLVFLCERMGFETGIDLQALMCIREFVESTMPNEMFHGKLSIAGPPPTIEWSN